MELLGTFQSIAEISIALAGFTGVVVALGRSELERLGPVRSFSLTALFYWSLGTMFLAFVPIAVLSLGDRVAAPWRVCHAIFALFHTWVFVWFFRRRRAFTGPPSVLGNVVITLGFGVLGLECAVALGFLLGVAPFLYLVALLWFLFLAALSFATLVFYSEEEDQPGPPGA